MLLTKQDVKLLNQVIKKEKGAYKNFFTTNQGTAAAFYHDLKKNTSYKLEIEGASEGQEINGSYTILGTTAIKTDVEMPSMNINIKFKKEGLLLKDNLFKVLEKAFKYTDPKHDILSGVLVNFENGVLKIKSSDSYRLYQYKSEYETINKFGEAETFNAIIPCEAWNIIKAEMKQAKHDLFITAGENGLLIEFMNRKLYIQNGPEVNRFPNFDGVIKLTSATDYHDLEFQDLSLIDVKSLKDYSKMYDKGVLINKRDNKIHFIIGADTEVYKISYDCVNWSSSEKLKIKLNCEWLFEALKTINNTVRIINGSNQVYFKNENELVILMPMVYKTEK